MSAAHDTKSILVIDDEDSVVTYLSTLLEDNGYTTVSARDGNEALEKIKQNKPDLITLDISIPEKSGVKLYRELKESSEWSGIPIVIVTAVTGYGGESEVFEKFISSRKQIPPPEGFIEKPIDRDQLLQKIGALLS